eukprot:697192-Rhodomonas_salina.1
MRSAPMLPAYDTCLGYRPMLGNSYPRPEASKQAPCIHPPAPFPIKVPADDIALTYLPTSLYHRPMVSVCAACLCYRPTLLAYAPTAVQATHTPYPHNSITTVDVSTSTLAHRPKTNKKKN